ncbi:hypothetical protein KAR91_81145 [Candidatus Pacearchaeota archaeon]|nr:hypothetical protein [Candidatus Pacearchaeota archaeon]
MKNEEKKIKDKVELSAEELSQQEINEMNQVLLGLRDSKFWKAYKTFTTYRSLFAESALFTIDPFKEPTQMARNQGIRTGINDLEDHINALLSKMAEEEEEANKNAIG